MPLIPWRPLRELERFFEEEWEFFPQPSQPSMDLYEKDDTLIAEVALPGIDPKNIEVSIKDNVLRIEGKEAQEKEEKKKGYYYKEIRKGSFKRVTVLPQDIEEKKVKAEFEDGILRVIMPKVKKKVEEEKGRKIEIKVKK